MKINEQPAGLTSRANETGVINPLAGAFWTPATREPAGTSPAMDSSLSQPINYACCPLSLTRRGQF